MKKEGASVKQIVSSATMLRTGANTAVSLFIILISLVALNTISHGQTPSGLPGALTPVAPGQLGIPDRCVKIRHQVNNFIIYSEVYVEAWVEERNCTGNRLPIDEIRVRLRYTDGTEITNVCRNAEICTASERNYNTGRTFQCGSAAFVRVISERPPEPGVIFGPLHGTFRDSLAVGDTYACG